VATATASALLVDAARVPIYLYSAGSVIADGTRLIIAISAGVTAGTFVGVPVLGRIPEGTYRRVVGGLLLLLGISLLLAAYGFQPQASRSAGLDLSDAAYGDIESFR
jgi:uncharacterized membrane protein YfcA